jgi:hypothetical protein
MFAIEGMRGLRPGAHPAVQGPRRLLGVRFMERVGTQMRGVPVDRS